MPKVKFFMADTQAYLERMVNEFISDKIVINISYTTKEAGYTVHHCCCVLYNSLGG